MTTEDVGMFWWIETAWSAGTTNEFLIKPVCGVNQERTFTKTWTVGCSRNPTSCGVWWDVWMGVKADGDFSGWK